MEVDAAVLAPSRGAPWAGEDDVHYFTQEEGGLPEGDWEYEETGADVPSEYPAAYGDTSEYPAAYGVTSEYPAAYGVTSEYPAAYGVTSEYPAAYGDTSEYPAAYGDASEHLAEVPHRTAQTDDREPLVGTERGRERWWSQEHLQSRHPRRATSRRRRRLAPETPLEDMLGGVPDGLTWSLRSQIHLLVRVAHWRLGLSPVWRRRLDSLVSQHPFEDFSLLVWVIPLAACPWLGVHFLITASALVVLGMAIGQVLFGTTVSASPGRLYPPLLLLPRCSPYTLPSLELWTSLFFLLSVADLTGSAAITVLMVAYVTLLSVLRAYAATLMPHQIVFSVLGGYLAAEGLKWWGQQIWAREIPPVMKLVLGAVAIVVVLSLLAYRMEVNTAPLGSIPRTEFNRVLGNIARGGDVTVSLTEVQAAAQAVAQTLREAQRARRRRARPSAEEEDDDDELAIDPSMLQREVATALLDAARARVQGEADLARVVEGGEEAQGKQDSWSLLMHGMRRRQRPTEASSVPSTRAPRMLRETDVSDADDDEGEPRSRRDTGFHDDGGVWSLLAEAAKRTVGIRGDEEVDEAEATWGYGSERRHEEVTGRTRESALRVVRREQAKRLQEREGGPPPPPVARWVGEHGGWGGVLGPADFRQVGE
jgi:hypothetical protein